MVAVKQAARPSTRRALLATLKHRGATWDAFLPYITRQWTDDAGVEWVEHANLNDVLPKPSLASVPPPKHSRPAGRRVPGPSTAVSLVSGATLWGAIHLWPLGFTGNAAAESVKLRAVVYRLEGGCDCREHWLTLMDKFPPDFSSRAAYAIWTWIAHNMVNDRLGKGQFAVRAAAELYGWDKLDGFDEAVAPHVED